MGSIRRWQPLQDSLFRWTESRWRFVKGVPSVTFGNAALTPGGGGGISWPRKWLRTNKPRAVGEVSAGLLVDTRKLPWPSTPERPDPAGYSTLAKSSEGAGRS